MSKIDGKCDNPKCEIEIEKGKGIFWITGAYLCKKCYKEWSDGHDKLSSEKLEIEEKREIGIEKKIKKEIQGTLF